MEKKQLPLVLLLFMFLSFSLSAWTADSGATLKEGQKIGISLAPLVSLAWGHSNELVFDSSSDPYPYLSRLQWQLNPVLVAGIKSSINIHDKYFINAAFGTALNTYTGIMTDHDWITEYSDLVDTDWTNESLSDIYLVSSFLLDSNAAYRYYNRKELDLDVMLGFKYIKWSWTDSIVSLDYPEQDLDYLIGLNGIDYTVEYSIPYLGAAFSMTKDKFEGGLSLLYSFLVTVEDHDYHKLRNLHFYDSFTMGQYAGLSFFSRQYFTPELSLSLSYDFDWVPEIVGDVSVYDDSDNSLGEYEEGAGVSYMASSVSLSLEYNF